MSKLDNWIKIKLRDQQVSYDPLFWESYKAYESSQSKSIKTLWVLPAILLFLGGMGFLFLKDIHEGVSENQVLSEVKVNKGIKSALEETQNHNNEIENHTMLNSIIYSQSTNDNTFLVVGNINSKEKNQESSFAFTHEEGSQFSKNSAALSPNKQGEPIDKKQNPNSKRFPDIVAEDIASETVLAEEEEVFEATVENIFNNINSHPFYLSSIMSHLDLVSVMITSSKDFSQPRLQSSKQNRNTKYSLKASTLIYPSGNSAGEKFLGGGLAFSGQWEYNKKWFWASEIGLNLRKGTYGVQMDHPTIVFGFEKNTSGYQILPTSTWHATSGIRIGRFIGPWSVYGGIGLDHLISVYGNLYQYQIQHEPNGTTNFEGEKISSGKIGKEGFNRWLPNLEIGTHCNLSQQLALGISLNYYPGGIIKKNHHSLYDYRSDNYVHHELNSWNLSENNYHLSIYLKFRIK